MCAVITDCTNIIKANTFLEANTFPDFVNSLGIRDFICIDTHASCCITCSYVEFVSSVWRLFRFAKCHYGTLLTLYDSVVLLNVYR